MMMEAELQALLAELEVFGAENDAREDDRAKKMLNLDREAAELMSILVRSSQRQHLLEIGTSNGYSTIWLAWAARTNGGHVISIERSTEKKALADSNLHRAGLRDQVELILGDATEVVASLPGPFDFVFFDADRVSAPDQLKLLRPRLLPGALILADNVLSHPDQVADYLTGINAAPDFDHTIVPVGKGLSIAYRV